MVLSRPNQADCVQFYLFIYLFIYFYFLNGAPECAWEGKFDKIGRKKNKSKKTSKSEGLVLVTVAALVGPG